MEEQEKQQQQEREEEELNNPMKVGMVKSRLVASMGFFF